MSLPVRAILCGLYLAVLSAPKAPAAPNLLTDPTLDSITYTKPTSFAGTLSAPYFGQFGTYTNGNNKNSLTVSGWASTGYNFIFAPDTVDSGTNANGANTGKPGEAPGAYNTSAGYGSTYLWGTNNAGTVSWGGANTTIKNPFSGNFFAADGIFGTAAITQSVSGMTVGSTYILTFQAGLAQQQGYDNGNTGSWQVSLIDPNNSANNSTQTSQTFTQTAHGFSGWSLQTLSFKATAATETLSFLAQGGSGGQPPFLVLGGPNFSLAPEPSTCALLVIAGVIITGGWLVRRRRLALED